MPLDSRLQVLRYQIRSWLRRVNHRLGRSQAALPAIIEAYQHGSRYDVEAGWKAELHTEVAFWKPWIGGDPNVWHGYRVQDTPRLDPNLPLQDWVRELVNAPTGATVRLLDVGAGPATLLGKVWPERTVSITAVDALADEYNRMFRTAKITVPVPTKQGDGEHLSELVEPGVYDLAYSCNALDHSYDPKSIILQMLDAVKPGGWVVLEHWVNEAENEEYYGLHQWNFNLEDGKFVIWNPGCRIIMEEHLPPLTEVSATVSPREKGELGVKGWLEVRIRRGTVSS